MLFQTVQRHAPVSALGGKVISQKFVDGEQLAGEVTEDFVDAVISAQREITEATPLKPLPRVYHKSRAKYFSHLAEDLPVDGTKPEASKADR